jgi:hypothetical protein
MVLAQDQRNLVPIQVFIPVQFSVVKTTESSFPDTIFEKCMLENPLSTDTFLLWAPLARLSTLTRELPYFVLLNFLLRMASEVNVDHITDDLSDISHIKTIAFSEGGMGVVSTTSEVKSFIAISGIRPIEIIVPDDVKAIAAACTRAFNNFSTNRQTLESKELKKSVRCHVDLLDESLIFHAFCPCLLCLTITM